MKENKAKSIQALNLIVEDSFMETHIIQQKSAQIGY
jgi:hypothetical protein